MTDSIKLQTFDISLYNLDGRLPIQAVRSHSLNGMFHTEMGRRYSDLVDAMHSDPGGQRRAPLPFSLAPLFREGFFTGFRVGALCTTFADCVAEVWGSLAAKGQDVRLGSARMVVRRVAPGRPGITSYQELLEQAPLARGVTLAFDTPTRLRLHGNSGVLPIPSAVWQGYVQRWEAYSGGVALPPEFLRWVEFQVQTVGVTLDMRFSYVEEQAEWKGVMGQASYQAFLDEKRFPASRFSDYLRAWQALALYAEYCGTGEKVSMGMGRTRRLKSFATYRDPEEIA